MFFNITYLKSKKCRALGAFYSCSYRELLASHTSSLSVLYLRTGLRP